MKQRTVFFRILFLITLTWIGTDVRASFAGCCFSRSQLELEFSDLFARGVAEKVDLPGAYRLITESILSTMRIAEADTRGIDQNHVAATRTQIENLADQIVGNANSESNQSDFIRRLQNSIPVKDLKKLNRVLDRNLDSQLSKLEFILMRMTWEVSVAIHKGAKDRYISTFNETHPSEIEKANQILAKNKSFLKPLFLKSPKKSEEREIFQTLRQLALPTFLSEVSEEEIARTMKYAKALKSSSSVKKLQRVLEASFQTQLSHALQGQGVHSDL